MSFDGWSLIVQDWRRILKKGNYIPVSKMSIKITSKKYISRGKIIEIEVKNVRITLLLTWHLLDALRDYDFKVEDVLEIVIFPDEVVRGHNKRFVAHKLLNDYIVRAVYEYENELPVIITLYIAKRKRYFRGGIYEDKILSRFGHTGNKDIR